jgi:hypothetical protein
MGATRRLRAIRTGLRAKATPCSAEGAAASSATSDIHELSLGNVAAELSRRGLQQPEPATLAEGWERLASVVDDGWEKQLGLSTPSYEYVERVQYSDAEKIRAHLDTAGFCVVKGCFSEAEVGIAMDLVWAFLEGQGTGLDRRDPTTWTNDRWQPRTALRPDMMASAGLHDGRGVHQSAPSWFLRSRPNLKRVWVCAENTPPISFFPPFLLILV